MASLKTLIWSGLFVAIVLVSSSQAETSAEDEIISKLLKEENEGKVVHKVTKELVDEDHKNNAGHDNLHARVLEKIKEEVRSEIKKTINEGKLSVNADAVYTKAFEQHGKKLDEKIDKEIDELLAHHH
uniref:Uncharacterized protein n=1 Tax=Cacopsylla melanoneura TaxID=428564 RepID=A0A8D8QRP2_9HEMI